MSNTYRLEIVTPTSIQEINAVEYLRAPGMDGLFGVKSHHAPALISLATGELKVTSEGKTTFWATSGGFAEITGDAVRLLLETAEASSGIDPNRAKSALDRAEKRLKDKKMDQARARVAMLKAINRLKVVNR